MAERYAAFIGKLIHNNLDGLSRAARPVSFLRWLQGAFRRDWGRRMNMLCDRSKEISNVTDPLRLTVRSPGARRDRHHNLQLRKTSWPVKARAAWAE